MSAHEMADPWERLGALLRVRRGQIDVKFLNRKAFATETGLDYRVVYDLESHRRENFTKETLAAAEVAYRWREGSIAAVLSGGDAMPLPLPDAVEAKATASDETIAEAEKAGLDAIALIKQVMRDEMNRMKDEQREEFEAAAAPLRAEIAELRDELRAYREGRKPNGDTPHEAAS